MGYSRPLGRFTSALLHCWGSRPGLPQQELTTNPNPFVAGFSS